VTLKQSLRIAIAAVLVATSLPVLAAATKDPQATNKIDEALNTHYRAGNYDKAERTLQSAIDTCATKLCSKEVLGKLHVAMGVVRGKASKDLSGARKAFERARKADPNTTLEPKLVSPPVARPVVVEFYKVMERDIPRSVAKGLGPLGNLHCVPDSDYEIQTAQPIAVVCDPLDGAVRAELSYRMAGESKYTALLMSVEDGTFRANIPCDSLAKPGTLEVYIVAKDVNQEKIDSFGNSVAPAHYTIVNSTKSPVPTYPGQDAPKRCSELLTGVGALGESCAATQPCKHGLYCAEGACEKTPSCESDSDCTSQRCNDGHCAMEETDSNRDTKPSRWMVGLHGAPDFWIAGKWRGVCSEASQRAGDFYCYNRGETRLHNDTSAMTNRLPMTDANATGAIDPGLSLATIRVMASLDYVLTEHVSVGTRLGWAFLGGPQTIAFTSAGIPSRKRHFIPVHAEARGTYWLRSLGKLGLLPYVHVSAGLAEVDVNMPINAKLNLATRKLDAWHKMGPAFAGGGFGLLYKVAPRYGVQLNVNAMVMLPNMGFVFEPSLGGVVAF